MTALDDLPTVNSFFGVDLRTGSMIIAAIGVIHPMAYGCSLFVPMSYLLVTIWILVALFFAASVVLFCGIAKDDAMLCAIWVWYAVIFVVLMLMMMILLALVFTSRNQRNRVFIVIIGMLWYICNEDAEPLLELSTPEVVLDVAQDASLVSQCLGSNEALPNEDEVGAGQQVETITEPTVDPDLLSALGESTSDTPDYGEKIHENIVKLWHPILKKGIPKEEKEKIIKDHLIPDNCRLLQAPKLNAEISAAIPDMVRNRDKNLAASQLQLGAGITAINRGIDTLLKSNDKVQAMKFLSNGCRLLCESHHLVTQNRVKLIMPSLDKSVLNLINESERDETLFGTSLSDNIKAAKAIEKQGQQIKKPNKTPKTAAAPQPTVRPSTSYQGNWSAPPRYPMNRGGRGGYRKPAPAGARRPYSAPTQQPQRTAYQPAYQDKPRAPAPPRQ